jgi:hypothetical protein
MMQTGDSVMVMRKKRGTVIWTNSHSIMVGVGEKGHFNYDEQVFACRDVKRYQELKEEEATKAIAKDIPIGVALITGALDTTAPAKLITENGNIISGYGGAITLEPAVFVAESIGAFIEKAGYSVTKWHRYPATRHEPEDVEDFPVGIYPTIQAASQVFVKTLLGMMVDDYFAKVADEEFAGKDIWQD